MPHKIKVHRYKAVTKKTWLGTEFTSSPRINFRWQSKCTVCHLRY